MRRRTVSLLFQHCAKRVSRAAAERMLTQTPAANIVDSKPFVNIAPFGICTSLVNSEEDAVPQIPHVEQHSAGSEAVGDIVTGISDGLIVPFALAADSLAYQLDCHRHHRGPDRDRGGFHCYGLEWLSRGKE